MKRILLVVLCIALLFSLGGCDRLRICERVVFAEDTYITIRIAGRQSKRELKQILDACESIIHTTEQSLSRTAESGELAAFHANHDIDSPSDALVSVLRTALTLAANTDGAYDPTLGVLVDLWNISGGGNRVPSDDEIAAALAHVGYEKLLLTDDRLATTDEALRLDLGGIGKGYTLGQVMDYLRSKELAYAVISFGGNVGVLGQKSDGKPFQIALRDPDDASAYAAELEIDCGTVATSGDYERYFEENGRHYHHILNPRTGYPAESGLRSVAVYSENAALADGLSTALFVMGIDRAMALYEQHIYDFEAVFFLCDGSMRITDGLVGKVTPAGGKYTLDETINTNC